MKIKTLFSALAIVPLAAALAHPQSDTYGAWKLSTDSGAIGSLMIEEGICTANFLSAFSTNQTYCRVVWSAKDNRLAVLFGQQISYSVTEYLPYGVVSFADQPGGYNEQSLSLTFTDGNTMEGFMMGGSGNVRIVAEREQ